MRTAFDVQPGRILVVHPDRKAQRALHRVLSSTLCPVEIVELDAAVAVAADDPAVPTVIVIDQPLARTRPELVAGPGLAWIAVPCDDVQPARPEVVAELMAAGWRHVIGAPIALAGAELLIAVQKLLRGDPFGIDKHLGWGATIEATTLEDAGDRPAVVARLVEGAGRAGMSERVASLASVIVDELLANALFGAPAGGGGTRRDRADARFDSRPLAAREQVQLRWGSDARFLAVEVTDAWGSLAPGVPGPAIARASRRAAGASEAGMGLALAYACCHQLVLAIEPGRRSQAIALIDVGHRPVELGRAPSFHVFTSPRPAVAAGPPTAGAAT